MLRSLDQQHVNCFLALLAARTCLFHATPKTGVSVLAFFPCFAPCVAAHKKKKKTHEHYNLEMQTGFLLISLIWSNYDMLGGQRLGIAVSPAEFRLGFSCRCRFWRFLRSLPLERSGALIAGKRDFLS